MCKSKKKESFAAPVGQNPFWFNLSAPPVWANQKKDDQKHLRLGRTEIGSAIPHLRKV
ncbi:MAG: hypothetical protein K0M40_08860 [Prolixibacteraceae bacterium]|nr:hypothetical protein [Prolixibacteraceae bacterium]